MQFFLKKYQSLILTTLFGLVVGLLLLASYYLLQKYDIQNALLDFLPSGHTGTITLFIILVLGTSIGLPRQIAAFCAGYTLDIVMGALVATSATIIGCLISLLLARRFLANFVAQKYPAQLKKLAHFFANQTLIKAIIIRFIPAGSNFLTNIIAGVVHVPIKPYLLGSAIGFLPQMTIFAMMGNGVRIADEQQIFISLALFISALLLSFYLYKFSPKKDIA